MIRITKSWATLLKSEFEKEYLDVSKCKDEMGERHER